MATFDRTATQHIYEVIWVNPEAKSQCKKVSLSKVGDIFSTDSRYDNDQRVLLADNNKDFVVLEKFRYRGRVVSPTKDELLKAMQEAARKRDIRKLQEAKVKSR